MDNNIQLFQNSEFGEIRTITEGTITLFCGRDIAIALGYRNPNRAIARHCRGCTKRTTPTSSGDQEMVFIQEGDIYRLVARSNLPGADKFESWIFDEVLPSIRKTGGYIATSEDMSNEEILAKAYLIAQNTIAERDKRIASLTKENNLLKPKADYFDDLVEFGTNLNFRDTAKEFDIKPKEFTRFLLDNHIVYYDKYGHAKPYERYIKNGWFVMKEVICRGYKCSGTQTLTTVKGRSKLRTMMDHLRRK